MDLNFRWIGGATFILTLGDIKIAVDPALCKKGTVLDFFWFKSKRIENPVYQETHFNKINLWLISHAHQDHLDDLGIAKISPESKVICNSTAHKMLINKGLKDLISLEWNQSHTFIFNEFLLRVKAIPSIHGVNPLSAFFAGNVNGYKLSFEREGVTKTIYITGDTVFKRRILKSLGRKAIDLLIPYMGAAMGGSWIRTLTLNSRMLQKFILELHPKLVIPVHFNTFNHYTESDEAIRNLDDERIKILQTGDEIGITL